jgi:hypothetical protein
VDPSLDDSTAIDWSLISTRALISLYEANKERQLMQEWSSIIIIHVGMSAISSERRKLENFKIMAIYGFLYVYILHKKDASRVFNDAQSD